MLILGRRPVVGRLRVKSAQFVKTLEPTDSVLLASMCSINPGRKCSRRGELDLPKIEQGLTPARPWVATLSGCVAALARRLRHAPHSFEF
jgi:hypothetical protein